MSFRFGIIGLGRIGSAMLCLLEDAGNIPVWAVTSKQTEALRSFTRVPDSPYGAQVVFICVPDAMISKVAHELADEWGDVRGITFFHFSGLLSSNVLSPLASKGGAVASLHPLQSIMDPHVAKKALKGSFFSMEGARDALVIAKEIVRAIGAEAGEISVHDKIAYHAAAVIASNYLVGLFSQAMDIMHTIGLKQGHLLPLMQGTLSNIEDHGIQALTGPISRGDWDTVDAHLEMLYREFPDIRETYLSMGHYVSGMAGRLWPSDLVAVPKVLSADALEKRAGELRQRGMKIVFTNGCFDLLHAGHVEYLQKARCLGDCLVVGLNSDESVRRLGKAENRPINDQASRAYVLSGLSVVDLVCIFDEDTPINLIEALRPDVLVKGGDWKVDDIVGADIVRSNGGRVLSIDLKEGYSTTAVIEKIRGAYP